MPDTPPLFAPEFFDLLSGGQDSPAQAACGFALRLDTAAHVYPDWIIESAGDRPVRIWRIDCTNNRARIGFESLGLKGEITLTPHPSGWVEVNAAIEGQTVFTAFAEQIWEEHELYPPAFVERPVGQDADAPGRVGKRGSWVVLSAEAWPQLAPIAEGGFVMARALD
jgi:hypothetical protein